MNYQKGIFINLFLLLLLSFSALFVYSPSSVPEQTIEEEIPLLNFHVGEIAAVALIQGETRYGLIHRGGKISLEPSSNDSRLSPVKLQSFLYRLSKLTAKNRIDNSENTDENYGLNETDIHSTLILENGEKIRLSLGRKNPLNGTYYLKVEGDDTIYVLSENDAALFLMKPSDFMERQVLPRVELEDLNSVKYIEIRTEKNAFRIVNSGNFTFSLDKPLQNSLDYEKTLSTLIFPLLSLAPEQTLDKKIKLPAASDVRVIIKIDSDTYELNLYKQLDGSIYLTSSAYPGVYLLTEDQPFTRLEYRDLLNDSIYHSNVSEIQSITIQDRSTGQDYNIEISGESVNIKGFINGAPIDYPVLMDFFKILLKTGISRELDIMKTLESDQYDSMSIQIYKKNGSMDRLDYRSSEEGEQTLFVNGKANFTTYTKTVLNIRNALTDLLRKEGE